MSVPDEFVEFARAAFEHRHCRGKAEELLGGDVTVVTRRDAENVTCAHGIRYWGPGSTSPEPGPLVIDLGGVEACEAPGPTKDGTDG